MVSILMVGVATAVAVALLAAVALDLRPCLATTSSGNGSWPVAAGAAGGRFRAQRLAVWLPTGLMYAMFYCGRYAVAAGGQSPAARKEVGLEKEDFALITSCGFWAYAVSAPATGKLCDRLGVRRGMLLASAGFVATNLLAGVLLGLHLVQSRLALRLVLALLYSLNFALQGIGTAAAVKLSSAWYSQSERGVFAGVYNVVISCGYFLALGVSPSIASELGYGWVFVLPAVAMCLVVLLMLKTLVEEPPSPATAVTHPSAPSRIRQHPADTQAMASAATTSHLGPVNASRAMHRRRRQGLDGASTGTEHTALVNNRQRCRGNAAVGMLPWECCFPRPRTRQTAAFWSELRQLLANPTFVCYIAATACTCWVRDGLLTYLLDFLATSRGMDVLGSETTMLIGGSVTLGGCVGGVLSGLVSDRIFSGRRAPGIMLFTLLQLLGLAALWGCRASHSDPVLFLVIFNVTICILGNYTMLSYAVPADLPPKTVGMAAGIVTAVGYVASGLATGQLAGLIGSAGYRAWWMSLVFATLCSGILVTCGTCVRRVNNCRVVVRPSCPAAEVRNNNNQAPLASAVVVDRLLVWPSRESSSQPHGHRHGDHVQFAGIQDEFLRSRIDDESGELCFFQWGAGRGDDTTSTAERLLWRMPVESATTSLESWAARPQASLAARSNSLLRPIDDHVRFLRSRMRDPTSYFSARSRFASPY
jgi:sugar phosphate permease